MKKLLLYPHLNKSENHPIILFKSRDNRKACFCDCLVLRGRKREKRKGNMGAIFLFKIIFFFFLVHRGDFEKKGCAPLPSEMKAPKEVVIGGLLIDDEEQVRTSVVRIAVDVINRDRCLLPETNLKLVLGYDFGSAVNGFSEFLRMEEESEPVGFVGPAFSSVSRSVALASPLHEAPTISPTASAADLSDKTVYPYFSRIYPSDAYQGRFLAGVCSHFGWDRIAIASVTDAYGSSILEEFTNQASINHIKILRSSTFPFPSAASSRDEYLAQIRSSVLQTKASGARIILLACFSDAAADYFSIAMEEGMFGAPYTYLIADAISILRISESYSDDEDLLQRFRENMKGLIGLTAQSAKLPSPIVDEWTDAWLSADPEEYYGAGDERFLSPATFVLWRDVVYALAWGIDRLIRRGEDPSDGPKLLKTIQEETDFGELTGRVILKDNGDRFAMYNIINAQNESFKMAVVGSGNESGLFFDRKLVFSDGTMNVPDAAERVFVDWGDAEAIAMLVLFSFGLLVSILSLIVMMSHRSTPIMTYSSPRFVCGMAFGSFIGFANVFVWTGEPSSSSCLARPWLLVLNFVLIFGHLYAKAFRFLLVMKQRKKLLFRPIPDIHLFLCVFFYLLLFAIPCIVWTCAYPLDVTRSDDNPDNDKVNVICDGENSAAFLGVLLGLGGLSLLVGVAVACLNWQYHDFFSEATYIGYTMFTVCITCCVTTPMLFILDDTPHAFYIVLMLGILLSNAAVVVFMFFPKIYVIFAPGKNVVPLDESGALKTKKSSSPVERRKSQGVDP